MPSALDRQHGRLPWPTPDELDAAQRTVYDRIVGGPRASTSPAFRLTDAAGRLEGPFNSMLVNPEVGDALQQLGAAIRYGTALPDRCREIAILTLAVERRSNFEWYAHARVGQRCGLTVDELTALHDRGGVASLSPTERLVRRAVTALCRTGDLDDALHADLADALGRYQLAELITLAGYYDLLALSLRVWRTPLPSGETEPFDSTDVSAARHLEPVERSHGKH